MSIGKQVESGLKQTLCDLILIPSHWTLEGQEGTLSLLVLDGRKV